MSRKKYRLAAAAVSALAVATLGFGGTAAYADSTDQTKVGGTSQEAANPSLVNPNATVELNIEKHFGAVQAGDNNGTTQTISTPKLQGINFDVYQVVGVDLTTNAGWKAAAAAQGVVPNSGLTSVVIDGKTYQLTKVATVTTDANGMATFTKTNGVGLYYVAENLSTSGTITNLSTNATIDKATVTPSAPFFVTLPMTNPKDLDKWMYDVRVYPKNQADSMTKTVTDETTYTVGSAISYTLTSTISPLKNLGYYYISDNNGHVTDTAVSLSIVGAATTSLNGCDGTASGLTGCDYLYWLDSDATAAGSQLKVVFTTGGLAKLEVAKAADPSAQVATAISGKVASVPTNGEVPNTGSFIPSSDWYSNNGGSSVPTPPPSNPSTPTTPPTPDVPGIPSNPVVSYFGNITVNKTLVNSVAGDTAAGATFAVYVDPTPTTECDTADVSGTALGAQTIAAGETSVTFSPLRASNWADNRALANSAATGWIQYCVVEIKAPAGYNLNAQPFAATIDYASGNTTLTRTATVEVSDEKSNLGNQLPLTGGEGVAAVSVVGLLLVGGGVAYYLVTTRRRREATTR